MAQQPSVSELLEKARSAQPDSQVWVCPMDADVRSHNAGTCPRCGMALKAGLPEQAEYHLELDVKPKPVRAGEAAELAFTVLDPWKHRPVANFQVIHEKLFHMFLIGEDLEHFEHEHPVQDGTVFRYRAKLPRAGMYRVLGDFYPDGGTPQLIAKTLYVAGGAMKMPKLAMDASPKKGSNVEVAIRTVPEQPIIGQTTQVHFELRPGDGIEKYLGAWGHMLAASDDLIDLTHTHPFIADGGPKIQFNLVFARPRPYRVWVQFQRAGVVNTAHFDIVPTELR
jgi:Heavy metal binding domain